MRLKKLLKMLLSTIRLGMNHVDMRAVNLVCWSVLTVSCGGRVAETPDKGVDKPEIHEATAKPSEALSQFDSLLKVIPLISVPHKFNSGLGAAVSEAKYSKDVLHLNDHQTI